MVKERPWGLAGNGETKPKKRKHDPKHSLMKIRPESTAPVSAANVLHAGESLSMEEQIARRAHELWQQRGHTEGADLDDWLQAERELNPRASTQTHPLTSGG
jgi:hypothetical protein